MRPVGLRAILPRRLPQLRISASGAPSDASSASGPALKGPRAGSTGSAPLPAQNRARIASMGDRKAKP